MVIDFGDLSKQPVNRPAVHIQPANYQQHMPQQQASLYGQQGADSSQFSAQSQPKRGIFAPFTHFFSEIFTHTKNAFTTNPFVKRDAPVAQQQHQLAQQQSFSAKPLSWISNLFSGIGRFFGFNKAQPQPQPVQQQPVQYAQPQITYQQQPVQYVQPMMQQVPQQPQPPQQPQMPQQPPVQYQYAQPQVYQQPVQYIDQSAVIADEQPQIVARPAADVTHDVMPGTKPTHL